MGNNEYRVGEKLKYERGEPQKNGSAEVLNEFSIKSATPAIALGYLVAQHQKVKSAVTRGTSAKTIEDRLTEILKVQLVQSRQSLAMGALLYGLRSKKNRK